MARKKKNSQQLDDSPFIFDLDELPDAPQFSEPSTQRITRATAGKNKSAEKALMTKAEKKAFKAKRKADRKLSKQSKEAKMAQGEAGRAYSAHIQERFGFEKRIRTILILGILTVVLIPVFTVMPTGVLSGTYAQHGIAGFFDLLGLNLTNFNEWISTGAVKTGISAKFFQTLTLAIVGAALALNGAVYQGAMNNSLASPSTLGVMSGGALGATLYVLLVGVPAANSKAMIVTAEEMQQNLEQLNLLEYIGSVYGQVLFCIAGCMAVVSVVLLVSKMAGRQGISKAMLVIIGQVMIAMVASCMVAIRYWVLYNGTAGQLEAIMYLGSGYVNSITTLRDVLVIAVPLFVCFAIVFVYRFKLNLLAFGDSEAKAVGVNADRVRTLMIVVCTLATAIVVSFCGQIAYVGFLVPYVGRRVVGPDFRYLIPCSMFIGSIYVMLANFIMNFTGILQGSIGTFTSIIGIVFFVALIVVQRARGRGDWI